MFVTYIIQRPILSYKRIDNGEKMERRAHGKDFENKKKTRGQWKRLPRFLPGIRNYVPHDVVTFYFGHFSPYI